MLWCGQCCKRGEYDNFQSDEPEDEYVNPQYECEYDKNRYKKGIEWGQFMTPFQCDGCVLRTLSKQDPIKVVVDREHFLVTRRNNLDDICSRDPSTIRNNMGSIKNLISTCEASGFESHIPSLGPYPVDDVFGYGVAFSMLFRLRRLGRHS